MIRKLRPVPEREIPRNSDDFQGPASTQQHACKKTSDTCPFPCVFNTRRQVCRVMLHVLFCVRDRHIRYSHPASTQQHATRSAKKTLQQTSVTRLYVKSRCTHRANLQSTHRLYPPFLSLMFLILLVSSRVAYTDKLRAAVSYLFLNETHT